MPYARTPVMGNIPIIEYFIKQAQFFQFLFLTTNLSKLLDLITNFYVNFYVKDI